MATTFLSSLLVSFKLYGDSDSKNLMVVFSNDGLVTLRDGLQLVEKLPNCLNHAEVNTFYCILCGPQDRCRDQYNKALR